MLKKLSRKIKRKVFLKIKPNVFSYSYWFVKLTNKFMQRGRKASVEKIILRVFKKIKIKYHKDALKIVFLSLIKNRPLFEFASIRVGRETKQIPLPLSPRRQLVISLNWFVMAIKYRCYQAGNTTIEKIFYQQLTEIMHKKKTNLTKRRLDHIKELLENRVNLHLRKKLRR